MGKGKYKHKQQNAQTKAKQQPAQVELNKQKEVAGHTEAAPANRAQHENENKMEQTRLQKAWKWVKHESTFTNVMITAFTGILALAAIYQFVILNSQLDTMRKDQRPWIKITLTADKPTTLAPLGGTIHLVNNGKTPAKGIIHGDFVVEIIKNGDQPRLDYPWPHIRFTMGMIVPSDTPSDIVVYRLRAANNTSGVEPDNLTVAEFNDFIALKTFVVIYGTVHYADFFGTEHWTKFCAPLIPEHTAGDFSYKPCSDYGDVDDK
jgi:hypothetical protein